MKIIGLFKILMIHTTKKIKTAILLNIILLNFILSLSLLNNSIFYEKRLIKIN